MFFKCEMCNKQFNKLSALAKHIGSKIKDHKITAEDYYMKYINTDLTQGSCKICTKRTAFYGISKGGYAKYCSKICAQNAIEVKEKVANTNLEKYGSTCSLNSIHCKKIMVEKYGAERNFQSIILQEHYKKSNLEKYGVEYIILTKEIQEKIKTTMNNKYNVNHALQSEEIRDKISTTNIERYGNKYSISNIEVRDKIKQTNLERYGVEYFCSSNEFKVLKSKNEIEKMIENLFNNDRLNSICKPNFSKEEYIGVCKADSSPIYYSWICCKCETVFSDHINNGRIPRCLICYPYSKSIIEQEVIDFCKEYYPNLSENNRSILPDKKELDLYISDINLAIEIDGLYWHSEDMKSTVYHLNKTKACDKLNIQLIHIFEDEWEYKKEIIKSMLLYKMKKITNKIYARKCNIKIVDKEEASKFCNNCHIQGFVTGSVYLGLYYQDELVSFLSFGKPRYNKKYEYEILRFCNKLNYNIIGGFSKLLKYFKDNYTWKKIITYADRRYSKGDVYINNKFNFLKYSQPCYYYVDCGSKQRLNRTKFQKHKLSKILKIYNKDLSEQENMKLNGYTRIWDCGNLVFEYI